MIDSGVKKTFLNAKIVLKQIKVGSAFLYPFLDIYNPQNSKDTWFYTKIMCVLQHGDRSFCILGSSFLFFLGSSKKAFILLFIKLSWNSEKLLPPLSISKDNWKFCFPYVMGMSHTTRWFLCQSYWNAYLKVTFYLLQRQFLGHRKEEN